MSDDLVNRLRREAGTLATMYEAADEIERLRRLNSELTATHNKMVVWDAKQADEIERLRAALSSALHALKMDAPHRSEIEEISAAFTWETHT